MSEQNFYSEVLFCPIDLREEPLKAVESTVTVIHLHQMFWQFCKYLIGQKDSVLSCLVKEDNLTIRSAENRWNTLLEMVLPMVGVAENMTKEETVQLEGDVSFDQWILILFGVIASGKRLQITDPHVASLRLSVLNQWMKDFPFLQRYIVTKSAGVLLQKSVQRSWVILADEKTDLDAVVELVLNYQVLRTDFFMIQSFTLVASGWVQFQLEQKWNKVQRTLNYGRNIDWNVDAEIEPAHLHFVTELPENAIVLDCTKGEIEIPHFDFKDLLNWLKA